VPLRPTAITRALLRLWYRTPLSRALAARGEHLSAVRQHLRLCQQLGSHGQDVSFQFPLCIEEPKHLHVGDHVSIAAFVHIWAAGGVRVGNRVMIASHVAISTVTHDHHAPVMWGTLLTRPIRIEDDVWIGAHATILPGITIGRGAVVGAGSVVTRDVPPFAIVTGVPARVQRYREIATSNP
jgi:maltose O-acetyltransferase